MKNDRVPKTKSFLPNWSKNKLLLLFFLFFHLTANLYAQDTPVPADTLFQTLKKEAELAINRDPGKVKETGQKMQEFGEQYQHEKLRKWGIYFEAEGTSKENPAEAKVLAEEALAYFLVAGRPMDIARCYLLMGNILCNLNDFENGIVEYHKAIAQFEIASQTTDEQESKKRLTMVLANIGLAYTRQGLFDQAANYLFEAEKKAGDLQDSVIMGSITNSLGNVFFLAKRLDESQAYYRKCYALALRIHHQYNTQVCMTGIGNIHFERGQFDSAAYYAERSVAMAKSQNNSLSTCVNLSNLANIYGAMGNCERSDSVNQEILKLARSKNLPQFEAKTYFNLAACAHAQQQYRASIRHAEQSLLLGSNNTDLTFMKAIHELLSADYEAVKDYQKSLEHFREYKSISDSILNESSMGRIQELQTRYQTERKEREIERLSEANRIQQLEYRQNLSWLIIGLIGLSLAGAVFFFYNRQRALLANNQQLETEQRLLRSQMNPHFIFNALTSIQTYLLTEGQARKGAYYLTKFAKLIRRILEHSRVTFVPLSDELETLEYYLALQQLRFEQQFSYQITTDTNLDLEDIQFPPMLLQPAVENAIEHGDLAHVAGGKIVIEVQQEEMDRLLIKVTDNGIGREAAKNRSFLKNGHRSLASTIIQERIQLLKKTYNRNISYTISDGPENGTIVTYYFPLKPETKK